MDRNNGTNLTCPQNPEPEDETTDIQDADLVAADLMDYLEEGGNIGHLVDAIMSDSQANDPTVRKRIEEFAARLREESHTERFREMVM